MTTAAALRHFRSKADIFDAVVMAAMSDEKELAARFVEAGGTMADRLEGMVLALHALKRERLETDPEIYSLYRRIVEDRPDIIADYSTEMTMMIACILEDGRRNGEVCVDDIAAAAGVVRDAVTVFVHPAHVAAAVKAKLPTEMMARNVVRTVCAGLKAGLVLATGTAPLCRT